MTKNIFLSLILCCLAIGQVTAETIDKNKHVKKEGLLLLAYGMDLVSRKTGEIIKIRNEHVSVLAQKINQTIPTEVAFGLADPIPIQAAVDRLEKRGVISVTVVPVFVSSHSAIIGNLKYIVGLQNNLSNTSKRTSLGKIDSALQFKFTSAMDTDQLVSNVLLDKAVASSKNTAETTIILVAHGPENPIDNVNMIHDMQAHAGYIEAHGKFKKVLFTTLRGNSAKVDDKKITELRAMVELADNQGDAVLLPMALSVKGLSHRINKYLDGMNYTFADAMMPHQNIQTWIVEKFQKSSTQFVEN